jgi:hypothetical protein
MLFVAVRPQHQHATYRFQISQTVVHEIAAYVDVFLVRDQRAVQIENDHVRRFPHILIGAQLINFHEILHVPLF